MLPRFGLCDACVHQKQVGNTRGSTFSLCGLARTDPRFPKYPRMPVLRCDGHLLPDEPPVVPGPCDAPTVPPPARGPVVPDLPGADGPAASPAVVAASPFRVRVVRPAPPGGPVDERP